MSVTPTTMKCPVCPEHTLETISASIGSFERCPNCGGLFILQDLIAAASQDKAKCREALEETKALLLPTEKWCPKCLQKLFDGRVRSRGVIFTVCSTCQTLWADLALLGQFEEAVERTLRVQIDLARDARAVGGVSKDGGASYSRSTFRVEMEPDSGLGHFFRAFARFFDRWADRFSGRAGLPKPPRVTQAKAKPGKPEKTEKPEKKPLILQVTPAAPPPLPPPLAGAPSIEIPEFVFPEEVPTPAPPPLETPPPEPTPAPEPPTMPEPVPIPEPEPIVNKTVEPPPAAVTIPEPEPVPEPEPIPEPKAEPKPDLAPEPVEKRDEQTMELLRLMGEDSAYLSKPTPKPAPKPPVVKPPISKPVEKKLVPQPSSGKPGFFAKLKTAWNPSPKKTIKPVVPAKLEPAPKPAPLPQAAPAPKPSKPQKPAGPGFFAKLFAPRKPVVKAAAQVPTPAAGAAPAPTPVAKSPEPQKEASPIIKKPILVAKKPLPVKPKRAKIPRAPVDHLALWPPWGLALSAVVCSAFRDFGFEGLPAVLWGLAGWAIGLMVRLGRLYPFKPFEESSLNDLAATSGSTERRGRPIILIGQLVPSDELNPKSELVFKQDEKTLVINRLGRWDVIPRLFGLSNPRQLPKGDVTLKGWYRPGPVPSLEVHDIRAGKLYRKSMVRSLRWASAAALFVLTVVVSLALD
jgi:Zn-finger nucleic acid-binding protein